VTETGGRVMDAWPPVSVDAFTRSQD